MKGRITVNPGIQFGKPCVAGTRIPVQSVLELVREGASFAVQPTGPAHAGTGSFSFCNPFVLFGAPEYRMRTTACSLRAGKTAGVEWYLIEDASPSGHEQVPASLPYLEQIQV